MKTFTHNNSALARYKSDLVEVVEFLEKKLEIDFSDLRVDLGENKAKMFYGSCDHGKQVYINGAYFQSKKTAIKTFIHEAIHAWQYQTKRMAFSNTGDCLWMGRFKKEWVTNELLSPWELEAVTKTNQLYSDFKRNK